MSILLTLFLIIISLSLFLLFLQLPHLPHRDMSLFLNTSYAHRGLWNSSIPENSLEAFQNAVNHGYGIELDVQETADHQLVVFHDADLQRLCQDPRRITQCTYSELQELRLNHTDARIPLFTEVLRIVDGQVPLLIEIKTSRHVLRVAAQLDALLKTYAGLYMIESFDARALLWYRMHHREVRRGQLAYGLPKGTPYPKSLQNMALSSLCMNIMGRPDFIAFDLRTAASRPLRALTRIHTCRFAWTCTSEAEYHRLMHQWDAIIFESFTPGTP